MGVGHRAETVTLYISAGLILAAEKANSTFLQAITQKVGNTKLVPQAKDS